MLKRKAFSEGATAEKLMELQIQTFRSLTANTDASGLNQGQMVLGTSRP